MDYYYVNARAAQQLYAKLFCDIRNKSDLLGLGMPAVISIIKRFNHFNRINEKYRLEGLIYVLVSNETQNYAENSTLLSYHPVLRVRKCYANGTELGNSCSMFFDQEGRVYQDWADYKKNNTLPKGIMVAPRNGNYSFLERRVILNTYPTPPASVTNAALQTLDTLATFAGFLAATAPISAFCGIRMPSKMIVGAMGLFATCYSTLRYGAQLVDRYQHEQPIGPICVEWFAIGNGLIGLGGAPATSKLVLAAAIILSGYVLVCSSFNLYLKKKIDEKITKLDYLQLARCLVQFMHTVYNFSKASSTITKTQNNAIHRNCQRLSHKIGPIQMFLTQSVNLCRKHIKPVQQVLKAV